MNDSTILTQNLGKRYGAAVAVERLDLEVHRGEVFGLLGPNGSGKTTTILMLLGLTEPSSGEIRVTGLDPRRHPLSVKRRVGYLPDTVGFYNDLSGRQNLAYAGALLGLRRADADERIDALLQRVGLSAAADQRVRTYSRGMRQRLGLAGLLLKRPRLAILDEPTLGLDPEAAEWFLDTVRALRGEGMTLLIASHLLHQVQSVCDRVGLFARGRMALTGTVAELAREVLGAVGYIELTAAADPQGDAEAVAGALRSVPGVTSVSVSAEGWRVAADGDVRAALLRTALEAGAQVTGVRWRRPQLDQIYRHYFGAAIHEA
ncbi:MAG TPA: ABC transporter ATP-binding protein [Gammaproteobacteria bacterium]|nr:ABC transporter ATP-binding protein [Gammaproteobacteria bacterium]